MPYSAARRRAPPDGPRAAGIEVEELPDAVERAIRARVATFDLLRGREPYEYRWGAPTQPTCRRTLRPGRG